MKEFKLQNAKYLEELGYTYYEDDGYSVFIKEKYKKENHYKYKKITICKFEKEVSVAEATYENNSNEWKDSVSINHDMCFLTFEEIIAITKILEELGYKVNGE